MSLDILSLGNSKLGTKIRTFGLDRSTCKFKSESCRSYCMAARGHFLHDSVQSRYRLNYLLSTSNKFVEIIYTFIKQRRKSLKYVRLHPSGDFYSQTYANKWMDIAQRVETHGIKLLAYTRNPIIDFSKRSENFVIFNSIDGSTKELNPTLSLKAWVEPWPEGVRDSHMTQFARGCADTSFDYENTGFHLFPAQAFRLCDSTCDLCKYCFLGKGNVGFIQKG